MNRSSTKSDKRYGTALAGVLMALCASIAVGNAKAEEAVIYSYMRTSASNSSYMLMPQVVDVAPVAPAQIFDTLRRRKLPTYGATQYDEKKNAVSIDETKCSYSAIISAEIAESFLHHGFKLPKFSCRALSVDSGQGQLPHYVAVVPLWQALDPKFDAPEGSLVQIGDEYATMKSFRGRVAKRDKSVMQAIEVDLRTGAGFVRSGVMRGMIANGVAGAEKRIVKELESSDDVSVNAALEALLPLSGHKLDKTVVEKMGQIVEQSSPHQIGRATAALAATSKDLQFRALSVLFRSAGDAPFQLAQSSYAKLSSSQGADFFNIYGEKILTEAPATHVAAIAEAMHGSGQDMALERWLEASEATANAIAAATWLAENSQGTLLGTALSVLLESDDDVLPYDAWDRIVARDLSAAGKVRYMARGLNSPHALIRHWAYRGIESSQVACNDVKLAIDRASRSGSVRYSGAYLPMIAALYGSQCKGDDVNGIEPVALRKRVQMAGSESIPSDMRLPGALLALARLDLVGAIEVFAKRAYDSDAAVRRDVAYGLRWIGENGDSLRASLLKDSDESVVLNVLWGLGQVAAEGVSVSMAKEIISRSKQSEELRIVGMQVMATKVSEKNGQTISTYISNEMFDASLAVKIAAIRALSAIAKSPADPLMRENALSSLALMAQDASSVVVFHTLRGLVDAQAPDIDSLLSSAQKAHPDVYRRIVRLRVR